MSRHSKESRRNEGRSNNEIQEFGRGFDPFNIHEEKNHMMRQFDNGFGRMMSHEAMSGDLMRHGFGFDDHFGDPLQKMNKFSDNHTRINNLGKPGQFQSHVFVSSSVVGPDGKRKEETYFENSAGQHQNGHTISQRQQGYKNNQGVNKIAQERMLNDKGRKIIKNKIGNQVQESNHYYNMDGDEIQEFDSRWKNVDKQTKFLENQKRYQAIGPNQYRDKKYPRQETRQIQQQRNYPSQKEYPSTYQKQQKKYPTSKRLN